MKKSNHFDLIASVSDCGRYIFNKVKGDIQIEEFTALMKSNNALFKQYNVDRVLSDLRESVNKMSISENYDIVRNDMKYKELEMVQYRTKKVAVIVEVGDNSHYAHETFAINAGFNLKVFFEETEAKKWLLEA